MINALNRSPFYQTDQWHWESFKSVNALNRALSISTLCEYIGGDVVRVSMPLIGLSPFLLPGIANGLRIRDGCVNALNRALSISTQVKERYLKMVNTVSMPLIGLSPFLRVFSDRRIRRAVCVSMPLIGLSPFLPSTLWFLRIQKKKCVNALNRALSISTNGQIYLKTGSAMCVNALNRALSISTVPSKKPCKIKVCEARFCTLFAEYSVNVQIQPFRNGFLYPLVIILSIEVICTLKTAFMSRILIHNL